VLRRLCITLEMVSAAMPPSPFSSDGEDTVATRALDGEDTVATRALKYT
jgi:hypothetical protein